jgi:pimeloyl-ACP methyl ester carboxylesterase
VEDYTVDRLTSDVLGFADVMGVSRFHLIGHDWGGLLAWQLAANHPDRLISLAVLSTPHVNAFLTAVKADDDQREKSKYIDFFRLPGELAESLLLADDAQRLRSSYQGKLSARAVESNVRRIAEKGAMRSALNWYRALDLNHRIGSIEVPTLYIWGRRITIWVRPLHSKRPNTSAAVIASRGLRRHRTGFWRRQPIASFRSCSNT